MGGIKHAPGNRYLVISTRLSRSLTLARTHLDLANVAVEDLLLVELGGGPGTLDPVLYELDSSLQCLLSSAHQFISLEAEMRSEDYVDLMPLRDPALHTIGELMASHGLVKEESWNKILEIFRASTFYGVISHFKAGIDDLKMLSTALREKCEGLRVFTGKGEVNIVLEQNFDESIKAEFAALHTAWSNFMNEFLASSLISTEIWYRYSDNGSLLDHIKKIRSPSAMLASCEA